MSSAGQLPLAFPIDNEFSFETFVTPAGCRALVDALQALPGQGEQVYYIWGAAGVGKTHLLQALCHHRESAVYVPLSQSADFTPAILEGLESLTVVCLDDVDQVLGEERSWEEALFKLFNRMREQGNVLVLSAAAAPRALETVLPDLASRLSWAMVYQLPELDDEGKASALRRRANVRGFQLSDDILQYILQHSSRRMDSLFAVLDRMDERSLREKRKITIPFIRGIMGW